MLSNIFRIQHQGNRKELRDDIPTRCERVLGAVQVIKMQIEGYFFFDNDGDSMVMAVMSRCGVGKQ